MTKTPLKKLPHKLPQIHWLHIDCDPLVYKYGAQNDTTQYWVTHNLPDEDNPKSFRYAKDAKAFCKEHNINYKECTNKTITAGDFKDIVTLLRMFISKHKRIFQATKVKLYLSPSTCFRNDLFPEYKANRKNNRKPTHYKATREWLLNQGAIIVDGLEADDVIGINHFHRWAMDRNKSRNNAQGYDSVIVGEDKDFNNIPGWHYNPFKAELKYVTYVESVRHFYLQLLTGDSSDNIPGLKGIGPVKALEILGDTESEYECYDIVKNAWLNHEAHEDMTPEEIMHKMHLSAKLLWILWEPDLHFSPPVRGTGNTWKTTKIEERVLLLS